MIFDVAILGGGISGMAVAARLQARGLSTTVCEAHRQLGGCAGFFRRLGFAFDVGATTLVDFTPSGVGGQLLEEIGMPAFANDVLPGYVAWLPDRRVTLYRDAANWDAERLRQLGNSPAHQRWWRLADQLANAFWQASRRGLKLPIQKPADVMQAASALRVSDWPLARYLNRTVGSVLRDLNLHTDRPLTGLLAMLIEDTVHSTIDDAPLINASLGITIRGAGLMRARGGMRGFWKHFSAHYQTLGGKLQTSCQVQRISGHQPYEIQTSSGNIRARQVVSTLPIQRLPQLAPALTQEKLTPYLQRDADSLGGALVVFLGVPESEVSGQEFTHHQILHRYDAPLGNGNNMFISVSSPNDSESAPAGYRAVMLSTHCALADWDKLTAADYEMKKRDITERLLHLARRVYPNLGERACVLATGTPRTYERFTQRPRGCVGGVKQTRANSNQNAIPYDLLGGGFWLAGDATWPGLGTVAGVLGSRLVARAVLDNH